MANGYTKRKKRVAKPKSGLNKTRKAQLRNHSVRLIPVHLREVINGVKTRKAQKKLGGLASVPVVESKKDDLSA